MSVFIYSLGSSLFRILAFYNIVLMNKLDNIRKKKNTMVVSQISDNILKKNSCYGLFNILKCWDNMSE